MSKNPMLMIQEFGQSIWLDYIHREMLASGELQRLIDEDGLRGMTSNPKIFKEAIAGGDTYDEPIRDMVRTGYNIEEIYQTLTVEDIKRAADTFRPLYNQTDGRHGFVSLEVSPHLAHDTAGTIGQAHQLWAAVNRANLFIKVPATEAGLLAIEQLISDGVNVNVTLLFGLPRYRKVAEAYIAGLEKRVKAGRSVDTIASVASFFLSRIDVLVDPWLEKVMDQEGPKARLAKELHGQVAIASAKIAYQLYQETFNSESFQKLADHGARPQRLLWASTSTKNPEYSDVKYIEPLIGPQTVNTMPRETLAAYRDHGNPAPRLEENVAEARHVLASLPEVGIDIDEVTQQLEDEGVQKFADPHDALMESLQEKCNQYRITSPA